MATPGSGWVVTRQEIVERLKLYGGRLVKTAKSFGVKYDTLRKKIDPDPELVQLVSDLRNDYDHTLLDEAEDTLSYALAKRKKDMTNALKCAFYVLNNKGIERGYSVKNSPSYMDKSLNLSDLAGWQTLLQKGCDKKTKPENEEPAVV